jgi:hypothetical protein
MSFDLYNRLLKIRKSIGTLTPKVRAHLGVWGSFPHIFLHSPKHEMWFPSSFLARIFVSLCLGRKPNAKVTIIHYEFLLILQKIILTL